MPTLFDVRESNVNAHTSTDVSDCDDAYGGLPFRMPGAASNESTRR